MNTKPIPAIITLLAAFIACVSSIIQHASLQVFTTRLLVSVVCFLVIGIVVKIVIDKGTKTMTDEDEPEKEEEAAEDADLEDVDTKDEVEE